MNHPCYRANNHYKTKETDATLVLIIILCVGLLSLVAIKTITNRVDAQYQEGRNEITALP